MTDQERGWSRPKAVAGVDAAERQRVADELQAIAGSSSADVDRATAEELLTDAATVLLALERERLLVKRRGVAALVRAEADAAAAEEARDLSAREETLAQEIAQLRLLTARARRRLVADA